jgi:hypothetical protein
MRFSRSHIDVRKPPTLTLRFTHIYPGGLGGFPPKIHGLVETSVAPADDSLGGIPPTPPRLCFVSPITRSFVH